MQNAKISWNIRCLLVVLKSIFIIGVNASIKLADKSLFENESCILKIKPFLLNFCIFFDKILHVFLILYILRNLLFFCIISIFFAFSISQKNRIYSRNRLRRNFSKKSEHFREQKDCKNEVKWSRKKVFSENAKFSR